MSAIQPAQIKQQAVRLAQEFSSPDVFISKLHTLLEFYANRTHRPGQFSTTPTILPSYNAPDPVLRQVLIALKPQAESKPQETLALCTRLWEAAWLETRILAARLLGQIPLSCQESILGLIDEWVTPAIDPQVLKEVLTTGLSRVRRDAQDAYFKIVERWLNAETGYRKIGLQALKQLLKDEKFENFPPVYRLLMPVITTVSDDRKHEVLPVLQSLSRRVPQEAVYFLRQSLVHAQPNPDIVLWLIKKCVPEFPEELQVKLRGTMREMDARRKW
ncbi:MAG: DNA alkylation repair protein [Chloroflexota bacterium]